MYFTKLLVVFLVVLVATHIFASYWIVQDQFSLDPSEPSYKIGSKFDPLIVALTILLAMISTFFYLLIKSQREWYTALERLFIPIDPVLASYGVANNYKFITQVELPNSSIFEIRSNYKNYFIVSTYSPIDTEDLRTLIQQHFKTKDIQILTPDSRSTDQYPDDYCSIDQDKNKLLYVATKK